MMTHLSELSRAVFKHLKKLVSDFQMTPHNIEAERYRTQLPFLAHIPTHATRKRGIVEISPYFLCTPLSNRAMSIGKKWCGAGLKETMRLARVLVEAIHPQSDKAAARSVYPAFVAKCKDFRFPFITHTKHQTTTRG